MLIAQITDLHVVESDHAADPVDTNSRLRGAIEVLNNLAPQPDVVLVTGDLVENGRPLQYGAFAAIMSDLRAPFFVLPGNHDDRHNLISALPRHSYLRSSQSPFLQYTVEDYAVRIISLDTTDPGKGGGLLCEARLDWLEQALSAAQEKPTLIAMHHPPFRTGIRWIDAMGLRGGRRFGAIVSRHPQVKAVICGHAHRHIQIAWAGTMVVVAASTSSAQLDLTPTDRDGYDCTYIDEPGTIQLYQFDADYGLVSHTAYASGNTQRYAHPRAMSVRPQLERLYASMCENEYERRAVTKAAAGGSIRGD